MMASTIGMTLPGLAFSFLMKSVQKIPTSAHSVSSEQGNRLALVNSKPIHHVDTKI